MKPGYYIASFSGGKDSTAMVLELIARKYPLDEVLYCDVGKEFSQMYEHIEKVKKVVEQAGIKFTTLRAEHSFDWYMFEKPVTIKGREAFGFDWARPNCRWCTGFLKEHVIKKYLTALKKTYNVLQYVGLAYDEQYRLERKNNKQKDHFHPLVDWKWTEKDCLNYCYERGYNWGGLYEIFSRVSCWCCPLQSIGELRNLRKYFPNLWQELGELAEKVIVKYAKKGTMVGLDGAIEFTKDSGDSRIVYHSVNVDRFELLSPKSENNGETAKTESINNLQPATNVTEDDMPF